MPIDIPGYGKIVCENRQKVFDKISLLIDAMNREVLGYLGIKFESVKRTRLTMSLNYLRCTKKQPDWMKLLSFPDVVIEKHSTKQYEELHEYLERLKSYAYHIETCGEERNSYSKQIMMQLSCV